MVIASTLTIGSNEMLVEVAAAASTPLALGGPLGQLLGSRRSLDSSSPTCFLPFFVAVVFVIGTPRHRHVSREASGALHST